MNNQNTYTNLTEDEQLLARFTAYVVTACRNGVMAYKTKKEKEKFMLSLDTILDQMAVLDSALIKDDLMDEVFLNEQRLEHLISSDALLAAFLKLSDKERNIISLHLVQNKKLKEIGILLGLKQATVSKCYERAIKKIRNNLKGE